MTMQKKSIHAGSLQGKAPAPLTDEQKAQQVARFLAQKRETFAQGILFNLCQGIGPDASSAQAKALVHLSVEMADALMEELYPLQPDVKEPEKPTPVGSRNDKLKGHE